MKKILIALALSTAHYTSHAQQLPKTMPDKSWGQTAQDYTIATTKAALSTIGLFGAFVGSMKISDKIPSVLKGRNVLTDTVLTSIPVYSATNIALNKIGFQSTNGYTITQCGIFTALLYSRWNCNDSRIAQNDMESSLSMIMITSYAAGFLANLHAELQARGINNPISTFIANNPVTNALIDNTVVKTLRWALSLGTISFDENGYPKVGFNYSYTKIS